MLRVPRIVWILRLFLGPVAQTADELIEPARGKQELVPFVGLTDGSDLDQMFA
jgi:hypothetical protein